jgi:hypothetical protein
MFHVPWRVAFHWPPVLYATRACAYCMLLLALRFAWL